jgi:alpha,alpha-trehalose phosphorylase
MARHLRSAEAVQPIYGIDDWNIVEDALQPAHNKRSETIFALGNGFFGMRGTYEEGFSSPAGQSVNGTYVNGFYESETIRYPEIAYGFAEHSQTMLNVSNAKIIRLMIDDEPFDLFTGMVLAYRRTLDMRHGTLTRAVHWRSPRGREVRLEITRLVSLSRKSIAAIRYRVTPLNFSGAAELTSMLDGDVTNVPASKDPRVGSGLQGRVLDINALSVDGDAAVIQQTTRHSKMSVACAIDHTLTTSPPYHTDASADDTAAHIVYHVETQEGQPITLDKFIAYVTTQDYSADSLIEQARSAVEQARTDSFDMLYGEQVAYLEAFWSHADVEIDGDAKLQQGLRFNMFHLLQSAGRDGMTNIAAKGLTGEGYEGHYFWDTEMYVIPFFLHIDRGIVRKLLQYRVGILDHARARAREMGHDKGALFPWRTINGDECSAYFPAGTAQYHINADVAFAIRRYVETSGDDGFLFDGGAEVLFETARLWRSLGAYIPAKGGRFCINTVTGPDEYTAIVNNNLFTNMMAQENLWYAAHIADWMAQKHPQAFAALRDKIALNDDEVPAWKAAADNMYIPFDEATGLYMQDDSFFDKEPWDFANTPEDRYPLLLHYHPLVIYRHQVCKQADLVLALFLLGNRFSLDDKRRNYDFYERVTTHDSSLSTCIFSIVANEIGYHEQAYDYFASTSRMDLDDYHRNVGDGVHIANMAGTWMGVVNGFAGLRVYNGVIHLNPSLPKQWNGYRFRIKVHDHMLQVRIGGGNITLDLVEGDALDLFCYGESVAIKPGTSSVVVPLRG